MKVLEIWDLIELYIFNFKNFKKFIEMIKFENFILFKRFSDVLDRIFVFGKFMILDGLLSLKLCFVSKELMLVIFYKIFDC